MTTAAASAPPDREAVQGAAQAGLEHRPLPSPAGGASPASVRPRSRPTAAPPPSSPIYGSAGGDGRPPKPPPAIASAGGDEPRDDDAALERMRAAVRMAAQGKTQPEIAAHFGVTDRTVRAWLTKARELRLGTFRSLSAEDVLAEIEEGLRALEATAHEHLRAATAAGYGRQAALWVREIADLMERRLSLHGRIGAFDHLRQDRQAARDRRQDAAMGILRPGLFEDDAAWGALADRTFTEVPSAAEMDGPPDLGKRSEKARLEAAQDAEFDRFLRAQGMDPGEFNRAAKEGVFATMLAEEFGPEQ